MSRFYGVLGLLLIGSLGHADDKKIAARLKELGAEVGETKGVVTKVSFKDGSKLAEDDFKALGQLKGLQTLTLYKTPLSDATLSHFAGLPELDSLSMEGSKLTDDGYKHFATFKKLKSLSFFHPSYGVKGFTGTGLIHLKSLPNFERLTWAGTSTRDDALAAIGELTQLKELRTWHTYQTEAGNQALLKLVNLQSLTLGQRLRQYGPKADNSLSLSDETMATLMKIPSLKTLSFDESRLTAAGLSHLKMLPGLKKLSLKRIDISEADVEKLRAELKGVAIEWTPLTATEKEALEKYLKK